MTESIDTHRTIVYTAACEQFTAAALAPGFFAGWPNPPTPATHLALLHRSDDTWLACDPATGHIVGCITAITDGTLCASIPLLEVVARYQRRGIGTTLVRRMLHTLRHLYAIDLVCDPALQPFYERLGLQPATSMIVRNYANQAGRAADSSASEP